MYICLCNAVSDRDARAQITASRTDCPTVATIYRALGVKPKCGKCVPLVRQLLRQAVDLPQPRTAPAIV